MQENVTVGEVYPYDFLVENCPEDQKRNIEYILGLMDWPKNVDPHYKKSYFRPPLPAQQGEGFVETWVTYANPFVAAKELTILPGQTVEVKDAAAYGCILIQGHGKFGCYDAESAIMLRYGQLSADEYFVGEPAAKAGVKITNHSHYEPMVILKHFANNNPQTPAAAALGLKD